MNEVGRKVKEQYAATGGFTDRVFAVTALLVYRIILDSAVGSRQDLIKFLMLG